MTAYDSSRVAGEYLQAVFPLLTATERLEIEHVLSSLPQTNTDDKPKFSEKVRNRLLGCLPLEFVCDAKTKELIEQLRTAQAIPKNEPGVHFTGPFFREFGEEEYLREQGVPVEAEVNKKIRTLSNPVAGFATKHSNSNPSKKEVLEVLPFMRKLREALESANAEGAHSIQIHHAWGQLTEACELVSRLSELHCRDESQSFVRNALLEASTHHVPEPHPKQDQLFDESPSRGGPAARIAAVQGLSNLCRIADCATPDVLLAVERLARDPSTDGILRTVALDDGSLDCSVVAISVRRSVTVQFLIDQNADSIAQDAASVTRPSEFRVRVAALSADGFFRVNA